MIRSRHAVTSNLYLWVNIEIRFDCKTDQLFYIVLDGEVWDIVFYNLIKMLNNVINTFTYILDFLGKPNIVLLQHCNVANSHLPVVNLTTSSEPFWVAVTQPGFLKVHFLRGPTTVLQRSTTISHTFIFSCENQIIKLKHMYVWFCQKINLQSVLRK